MTIINPRQAYRKLYADLRDAHLTFATANPKLVNDTAACTLAVLIRIPETDPSIGDHIIIVDDDSGSSATRVRMEFRASKVVRFKVDGGGTNANLDIATASINTLAGETWHTVIGTFHQTGAFGGTAPDPLEDGDQAFLYLDGEDAGDGESATPNNSVLTSLPDLAGGTVTLAATTTGTSRAACDIAAACFANTFITPAQARVLDKALRGKDASAVAQIFPDGALAFQFHPAQYPGGRPAAYSASSLGCQDLVNDLPGTSVPDDATDVSFVALEDRIDL